MNRERIQSWIRECLNGAWTSFNDLHIDDLTHDSSDRSTWVDNGLRALEVASLELEGKHECVLLAIPLVSGATPIGMNFRSKVELESELSITPPSLYVYNPESRSWIETLYEAQMIHLSGLPDRFSVRYSEFQGQDGEMTRCIYIILASA